MGVKISIITVTFNRAHVIKDAIEGVLRQNYKNYEYIIVDGAYTDSSIDVVARPKVSLYNEIKR